MRIAVAALVLIGLVAGVWLLWPDGGDEETPTTEAVASTTTTGSTPDEPATTTTVDPTSTTEPESHVVETVEEAEEIVVNHYTQWFTGIYDEDAEMIRSIVLLDDQVEAAESQFGVMEFTAAPTAEGLNVSDIEILRSDEECLSVWTAVSSSFRNGSTEGVVVFRWWGDGWKFLSSWQSRNDLWEVDCDSLL